MLKLKLQYFGHLMRRVDSLDPDGSPGQEDQQVGGWGLALPTSACDPAPEQCVRLFATP